MNQLHQQNDEPNQNSYTVPLPAATNAADTQTAAFQTVVTQTTTTQSALKPEYVSLLLSEIETLLNKRFLYRLMGSGFLLGCVSSVVSAMYRASEYIQYVATMWNFPPKWERLPDITLDHLSPVRSYQYETNNYGVYFGYLMVAVLVCFYKAGSIQGQLAKRVQNLAKTRDVRLVGTLAGMLRTKNTVIADLLKSVGLGNDGYRTEMRNMLLRLLPQLRASDSAALNAAQKQALARALSFNDTELTLAILKALEQVGDDSAVPQVQKIAAGRGDVSRDWQIMEAANECLPYLQMRAEDRQAASQLLRPAAFSANETDAQQLLRANPTKES